MQLDELYRHHLRHDRARQALQADATAWATINYEDIDAVLQTMEGETERQTLLVMVAAAEAALQAEANRLASDEPTTPLGGLMAKEFARAGKRRTPTFTNILKAWRLEASQRGDAQRVAAIDSTGELVAARNWLAHGRDSAPVPLATPVAAWATLVALFGTLGVPIPPQPKSWI